MSGASFKVVGHYGPVLMHFLLKHLTLITWSLLKFCVKLVFTLETLLFLFYLQPGLDKFIMAFSHPNYHSLLPSHKLVQSWGNFSRRPSCHFMQTLLRALNPKLVASRATGRLLVPVEDFYATISHFSSLFPGMQIISS